MSEIEWTGQTVNPVTGCSILSEGCANCYAIGVAGRQMSPQHRGLTTRLTLPVLDDDGAPVIDPATGEQKTRLGKQTWSGVVRMNPSVLGQRIPKPRDGGRRRVFVNSMSDWFHPEMLATEERRRFIAACFAWMYSQPWCDFQLLTKRPEGLEVWLNWLMSRARQHPHADFLSPSDVRPFLCETMTDVSDLGWAHDLWVDAGRSCAGRSRLSWPPRNVMFGVTAENQKRADERLPIMAEIKRLGLVSKVFVSYEPALGPVDFSPWLGDTIDWLICGGESGARARPMHPDWARAARDQALASRTPFLFKQRGTWSWEKHVEPDDLSNPEAVRLDATARLVGDETNAVWAYKVGKGKSGSEIDGRRWLEFPVLVGDATTAYTIGHADNYDRCLLELGDKPMRKTGKGDRLRGDPEYPGGIVWQTAEEAAAAAPEGFAVYELELPGPWRECVYEVRGAHHLLPETVIVARVSARTTVRRSPLTVGSSGHLASALED